MRLLVLGFVEGIACGDCQPLNVPHCSMHPGMAITDVKAFSHRVAVMCKIVTLPRLHSPHTQLDRGLHQLDWSKEILHENNPGYYMHKGLLIPSSYSSVAERKNLFGANLPLSLQSRTLGLAVGHCQCCEMTEFLQV